MSGSLGQILVAWLVSGAVGTLDRLIVFSRGETKYYSILLRYMKRSCRGRRRQSSTYQRCGTSVTNNGAERC